MRHRKSLVITSAVALGIAGAVIAPASAAPVSGASSAIELPRSIMQLQTEQVRQRRYHRHRHGRRYRHRRHGHRHYYRGYWYATPWWLFAAPAVVSRCERWRRRCRQNWGYGASYRGCLRHHGCL